MNEKLKFYITDEINLTLAKDVPYDDNYYRVSKRHKATFLDNKEFYLNALTSVPNSELVILKDEYAIGDMMKLHYDKHKASENIKFDCDVAGIILPLAHADHSDLSSIVSKMGASEIIQATDTRYKLLKDSVQNDDSKIPYWTKNNIEGEEFYKFTSIPVFEAWKFLPGYRHDNNQIGENFYGTYFPVFELAFKNWLKTNFEVIEPNEVQK